ncbi:dre2p [Saccharomyces arboricola H-6]|uniref:Dre2p n=1 Tax=Saccharomyces arboricola (strain H-6 / AS 2.3317 / CBS 10644) TaxID=1160507 RepID=J8Q5G7_SACAR|nr:dre2p [Saccharomyces arboricola H-6]
MSHYKSGLLLIHPAITTTPEVLKNTKTQAASKEIKFVDQFLINKLNDGSINLENAKYDTIQYLTPESPGDIKFPKKLISILADSLKLNGSIVGLTDAYKIDALINGFEIVDKPDYCWVKRDLSKLNQTVSIPLKDKKKIGSTKLQNGSTKLPTFNKANASSSKLPSFKKADNTKLPAINKADDSKLPSFKMAAEPEVYKVVDDLIEESDDEVSSNSSKAQYFDQVDIDNDSIEEEDLIDEDDSSKPMITMITCGKSKTKKKKACKDCTCGMKEQEEREVNDLRSQQDKVIKFTEDELTEIDFTIDGKKVGGCGSCSLGDAFRCSGCPYLGLPAFKPGQPINLDSISDDL